MHRTVALLGTVLLMPTLLASTAIPPTATAAPVVRPPAAMEVERAYGDGAVFLEPRQGVDIEFRATRGDRVMLEVNSREYDAGTPCFGTQTLIDGRGTRTARIEGVGAARIMRVRTSGRTVLRFRGLCAFNKGQDPHPVRVQLTKVRMREVKQDGRTPVEASRRGYLEVAYVRVARDGRDTLTLRTRGGSAQYVPRGRVVVGNRVTTRSFTSGISVEAGSRYALTQTTWRYGRQLTRGQRIGFVVAMSGYAESLRAREHHVDLDDPALTLPAEPGREHVLVYAATPLDRAYVIPLGIPVLSSEPDDPWWGTWQTYSGGTDRGDPTLHRTIVASAADGADPQAQQVRVRRTARVADLVVDGPSVTFASTDPGTRFVAVIPASAAASVRLTAKDVSATGPWGTEAPPVVCSRDCSYPGLSVSPDALTADGFLFAVEPHELRFTFGPNTTGSVTLALTDIP